MSLFSRGSICLRCTRALSSSPALVKHLDRTIVEEARSARALWILSIRNRHLHTSLIPRQQAAAAAAAATEAGLNAAEYSKPAASPPSDSQIDHAAAMGPVTKFRDLATRGQVDKRIVDTLTRNMGLETMTQVQSLTITEALKGVDVLAQAKTGTGKTIAFLLPVLQNILSHNPSLIRPQRSSRPRYGRGSDSTLALIISPTRELAEQIAAEAKRLVQGTGILVQTAVGGTQKREHLQRMQREGCHILIGTPGRLKDIFSEEGYRNVSAPDLQSFVLDEADRLMDDGFWPNIQEILSFLPVREEQDRQTLLFSATIPQDVARLARTVLKKDMHYVRTVQENETPTIDRVKQTVVTIPGIENALPTVLEIMQRSLTTQQNNPNAKPFKALLYFNSTAEVSLAASLLVHLRLNRRLLPPSFQPLVQGREDFPRIYSIHSRLSQNQRTHAADYFRAAETGILVSSDVTARGMDFPGVTHVIQVGLPQTRESYIHRLGRTARAGREGEGWLLLPEVAARESRTRLGRLPLDRVAPDQAFSSATFDCRQMDESKSTDPDAELENEYMQAALSAAVSARNSGDVEHEDFEKAYLGLIGTYQWAPRKEQVIEMMNRWSRWGLGMMRPPQMSRMLAQKLGLSRVRGVEIDAGRFERSGGRDEEVLGAGWSREGRGRSPVSQHTGGGRTDCGRDRGRDRGFSDRDAFGRDGSSSEWSNYGRDRGGFDRGSGGSGGRREGSERRSGYISGKRTPERGHGGYQRARAR